MIKKIFIWLIIFLQTPVISEEIISNFENAQASQKLFINKVTEKNNRQALRKLALNHQALSTTNPMERYLIIETLSQVLEMTKEDENGIANIIKFSANKGDLADLISEMLDNEKFYLIYNNLSKKIKEKIALLLGNNLPEFLPKEINKATFAKIKEMKDNGELGKTPFDVIIVPGFTPLNATKPTPLAAQAKERLKTAAEDFKAGKAPFIIVTGGSVHPESTRINEAMIMKDYLEKVLNIPAERIIAEGISRHSTTNLRNSGRIMIEHGLIKAEIVSDPGFMGMVSQTDYFKMILFNLRYMNNHGQWAPGEIQSIENNILGIGNKRNSFVPYPGVMKKDYVNDPLDP